MWLAYFIVLCVFIIIIWKITVYIKKINLPKEDTFYYRVTDVLGNQSIIHNSGIKPSEVGISTNSTTGNAVVFSILKNEYNDGIVKNISKPYKIEIGYHPRNLFNAEIISIKEEDLLYKIEISPPKQNYFFNLFTKEKQD